MSLIEYCAYLKREISKLRSQLRDAINQNNLYEQLLQEEEEPMLPDTTLQVPEKTISYWQWLKGSSFFPETKKE
jgi:hypothetical protein